LRRARVAGTLKAIARAQVAWGACEQTDTSISRGLGRPEYSADERA